MFFLWTVFSESFNKTIKSSIFAKLRSRSLDNKPMAKTEFNDQNFRTRLLLASNNTPTDFSIYLIISTQ